MTSDARELAWRIPMARPTTKKKIDEGLAELLIAGRALTKSLLGARTQGEGRG
jgi:hypothetical protein